MLLGFLLYNFNMYKLEERIKWIQDKVKEANADGVAIAISGGIDSAVIAAMCKRAFPNNTLGLFLDINSSVNMKRNYLRISEELGIEKNMIDLSPTFETMVKTLFEKKDIYRDLETYEHYEKTGEAPIDDSYLQHPNIDLIKGNLKARLRMSSIYAHAQKHNYLVMETSNFAEDLIGYYTKWGDGAGDLAPITDLQKREVFELARELGLSEKIIEVAVPSADLWDGQTDEDELGFTYAEVEDYHKGVEINPDSKEKIESMIKRNQHKKDGVYRFEDEQ